LYVNNIVHAINDCSIELFADDTMIYMIGRDLHEIHKIVNNDLDRLFVWLNNNSLSFNVSKSKWCLFGKKGKLINFNYGSVSIKINNEELMKVEQIKYLGVLLDAELNFHANADGIMRKLSKKVAFISRVGKNLSMYNKKLLYNSIAAPPLEFCSRLLYSVPSY